jgi:ABC-type polysaccharide/polyol phosphate transport system ATPase subunit
MEKGSIQFEHVGKKYRKGKLLLKEALLDVFKPQRMEDFWALEDITFDIKPGETVGVIGPNGSGKSTLLKLLAEVAEPTRGKVKTAGRIAPLIDLGAGFHFELTGRENIYINGTILGLSKKEIDNRVDEIIDFAELKDFIDTPIKHYSSGMFMRLGFSVAVHVEPDILLVDEILAVGDAHFQAKSFAKMMEFKQKGVTMVIVSHAEGELKKFCDKGLYINHGKQKHFGPIDEAISTYQQEAS